MDSKELYQKRDEGHTPSTLWKIDSTPYETQDVATQRKFQDELIQAYKDFRVWQKEGKPKNLPNKALDLTFFNEVLVSSTAATKILKHAKFGLDQGMRNSDFPAEVMGCLIGHCPETTLKKKEKGVIVVVDSFALPCKGGAHSVDVDPATVEALDSIQNLLEKRDPRLRVVGWYHSHPFDAEANKHHCFFSQTDVSTQTASQKGIEEHGGLPYVGIVVDPFTSLRKRQFYMGAYRSFPDGETNPICMRVPDGKIVSDEKIATKRWRSAWNRYYELKITFFATKQVESMFKLLYWYNGVAHADRPDPSKQAEYRIEVRSSLGEAASHAVVKSHGGRSKRNGRLGRPIGGGSKVEAVDVLSQALSDAVAAATKAADARALMQLKQVAKDKLFAAPHLETGASSE